MTEHTARSKFDAVTRHENKVLRAGVVEGAFADPQQFTALAALFPDVQFEIVGSAWPDRACSGMTALVVAADGASAIEIDAIGQRLRRISSDLRVVVLLRNADVSTTRLLVREGAADVIPAPVSETSLAVTLDKLFRPEPPASARRQQGEIIAVLKAGGGVGATALAVQSAAIAARRGASVCLADLDLQFGAASLYMDLADAATVSDCMANGAGLKDVNFSDLLGKHISGARLLAAPRQVTPLDALAPPQTEALLSALKRSFGIVLVDLPSAWTSWTNRALQMADRIVIVTHLSVPHTHLVDRQIATLRAQGLDDRRLTLVCNALSPEQSSLLPVKAAERALGRAFDVVVPEDRKLMYAAINQGVEIASVQRDSKLEKAISELAALLAPETAAAPAAARGKSWWSRKP
jgi:pilus assembly protein CpaE